MPSLDDLKSRVEQALKSTEKVLKTKTIIGDLEVNTDYEPLVYNEDLDKALYLSSDSLQLSDDGSGGILRESSQARSTQSKKVTFSN